MRALTGMLAGVWALLGAATAGAAPPLPAAVLEVRPIDGAGPEVAEPLDLMIAGRLGERGIPAIGPSEVAERLEGRPELAGCGRGACLDELAAFLGAGRLLGGAVRRAGAGYAVEVWVYDVAARESVGGQAACEPCEAAATPGLAARALEDALERDERRRLPATLEVHSEPSAATVLLDGKALGVTPLVVRVPAGAHGLVVERRGFASQARQLRPEGGQSLELRFALETAEAARPYRAWRWTAAGAAVVAAAAAGLVLARDGDCADAACLTVRETRAEGVALVGLAGGLALTSGLLFHLDR